jgi:hypothetical protein
MEDLVGRQEKALALVEKIIALEPDESTLAYALKMRERLKLPMAVVLAKLWPELGTMEKVRKLGIARQTYYGWERGWFRPDVKFSRKLAALTGFDADEIRGHLPPRR